MENNRPLGPHRPLLPSPLPRNIYVVYGDAIAPRVVWGGPVWGGVHAWRVDLRPRSRAMERGRAWTRLSRTTSASFLSAASVTGGGQLRGCWPRLLGTPPQRALVLYGEGTWQEPTSPIHPVIHPPYIASLKRAISEQLEGLITGTGLLHAAGVERVAVASWWRHLASGGRSS